MRFVNFDNTAFTANLDWMFQYFIYASHCLRSVPFILPLIPETPSSGRNAIYKIFLVLISEHREVRRTTSNELHRKLCSRRGWFTHVMSKRVFKSLFNRIIEKKGERNTTYLFENQNYFVFIVPHQMKVDAIYYNPRWSTRSLGSCLAPHGRI